MADIRLHLENEIANKIIDMNNLTVGSPEYKSASEAVTKMLAELRAISELELTETKLEYENELNNKKFELDEKVKEAELNETIKHNKRSRILKGFEIGVPAALLVWGTLTSITFEEDSTMTSTAGKYFLGKTMKG